MLVNVFSILIFNYPRLIKHLISLLLSPYSQILRNLMSIQFCFTTGSYGEHWELSNLARIDAELFASYYGQEFKGLPVTNKRVCHLMT